MHVHTELSEEAPALQCITSYLVCDHVTSIWHYMEILIMFQLLLLGLTGFSLTPYLYIWHTLLPLRVS